MFKDFQAEEWWIHSRCPCWGMVDISKMSTSKVPSSRSGGDLSEGLLFHWQQFVAVLEGVWLGFQGKGEVLSCRRCVKGLVVVGMPRF